VIHKLINSISNKEELPQQGKESVIVPLYKRGEKSYYSNYSVTSLLPTTYKILSNILFSKLTAYVDEITKSWRKLHNDELQNLYSSPNLLG
jgi:hypothetical protein